MSRIGATLNGIERTLLNSLAESRAAATLNALRIATGKKINSAKDDPSGLIALGRFETQREVVTRTLANVAAASSMVSKTQLALDQIRTQLNTIRAKALEDQDQVLSPSQRTANQAAIDMAIEEINRLAGTTIDGRRVLDGSANFDFAGRNAAQIVDLSVYKTDGGRQTVSEARAELTYHGAGGYASAAANITLTGDSGATTFAVTTDTSLATIARQINDSTLTTGLTAEAAGNALAIRSRAYGTGARVDLDVNSGAFAVTGADASGTARGRNAVHGERPSISGTVNRAAARARLAYDAGGGTIAANATLADLKHALRRLTGGEGVDVVYDCIGGDAAEPAIRALAWQGRYLVVGFASGDIPKIPLNLLLLKGAAAIGVFWGESVKRDPAGHRANMTQLLNWVAGGQLKPVIHATYPLQRIAEALDVLDRREARGKVVVTM